MLQLLLGACLLSQKPKTEYTVTPLGTTTPYYKVEMRLIGFSLSDNGAVVGHLAGGGVGDSRLFYWKDGQMTMSEELTQGTFPVNVSEDGTVVGWFVDMGGQEHGFRWKVGGTFDRFSPDVDFIPDSGTDKIWIGDIKSSQGDNVSYSTYVWQDGKPPRLLNKGTNFPHQEGADLHFVLVDDAGEVFAAENVHHNHDALYFYPETGDREQLPTATTYHSITEDLGGALQGVNSNGTVCGEITSRAGRQGAIWPAEGGRILLDPETALVAINDSDVAVGTSFFYDEHVPNEMNRGTMGMKANHAAVWDKEHGIRVLDTLIDLPEIRLVAPYAINNSGQILCRGVPKMDTNNDHEETYLLTPNR